MAGAVFNLLLVGGVLYFYNAGNLPAAVGLAVFLFVRVFQTRLARIASVVSRLDSVPSEITCNTVLVCRFSVEHALSHPSIDALFLRLRSAGRIAATDVADWKRLLVENYKRKYKREAPFEEVRFNIKNNLIFKNGEPDFNDAIYHVIEIPYQVTDGAVSPEPFWKPIEVQIEVRLLLVNGMLVLQLGRFDKESSPKILRSGGLAVYETYVTLTSFPFLYFSRRHALPTRYLNLSYHATGSYKDWLASIGKKRPRRLFWRKSPNEFHDWRQLQQELVAYRVLCDVDNPHYSYSKVWKLVEAVEAKRDKLLAAQGFKSKEIHDVDDWRYPDMGDTYSNDYLYVYFQNWNHQREYAAEHWHTDYYEEMP